MNRQNISRCRCKNGLLEEYSTSSRNNPKNWVMRMYKIIQLLHSKGVSEKNLYRIRKTFAAKYYTEDYYLIYINLKILITKNSKQLDQ